MKNNFYFISLLCLWTLSTSCLAQCVSVFDVINGSIATPDGYMTKRMNRLGIINTCTTPKACDIALVSESYPYKVHTLVNSLNSPQCFSVILSSPCGGGTNRNLQITAYQTSFDPANICTNFLGDPGFSIGANAQYTPQTFSFTIAANSTYIFVVNEAAPELPQNTNPCKDYTIILKKEISPSPTDASIVASGPVPCEGTTSITGTGTGNTFVFTGPGGYVFSNTFRDAGPHSLVANGIKQSGSYMLLVYGAEGCLSTIKTVTVDGGACNKSTIGANTNEAIPAEWISTSDLH